jgi:transcriptional regulator with XRE-family HTH domain
MAEFGVVLRAIRKHHGLTQKELAATLDLSRSTIGTVETGHEAPSAGLVERLCQRFPHSEEELRAAFRSAQEEAEARTAAKKQQTGRPESSSDGPSKLLGGPYVLERFDLLYTFGHSKAPQEIIELRRVRATKHGAHDFGLKVEQVDSKKFETTTEVLFGGQLTADQRRTPAGETLYLRRIDFGRKLRRGQRHHFGLRYEVERDPEPNTFIIIELTNPTEEVALHLHFTERKPAAIWRYGPLEDERLAPSPQNRDTTLRVDRHGNATATFADPELGTNFGIAWRW